MRVAKGGQTVDIGRGNKAEFVRWTLTRHGWVSETVVGVFVRLSTDGWMVRIEGTVRELSRAEWEWCAE